MMAESLADELYSTLSCGNNTTESSGSAGSSKLQKPLIKQGIRDSNYSKTVSVRCQQLQNEENLPRQQKYKYDISKRNYDSQGHSEVQKRVHSPVTQRKRINPKQNEFDNAHVHGHRLHRREKPSLEGSRKVDTDWHNVSKRKKGNKHKSENQNKKEDKEYKPNVDMKRFSKEVNDKTTKVDQKFGDRTMPRGEQRGSLGFKKLERLTQEDSCEIVLVLANSKYGFESILKNQLTADFLILVIKALSKLCTSNFEENKVGILSQACEPVFLRQLSQHIALIPLEENKKRKENVRDFLNDLMIFLETVITLIPDKAADVLENVFLMTDTLIKVLEGSQSSGFSEDLKKKFEHLNTQFKICIEQKKKEEDKKEDTCIFDVPDDFREVSLFPIPEDILSEDPGFVRPNIVNGAYSSVVHYLDTHFRLLREDFVSPLREGIAEYIASEQNRPKRFTNIRIYRKVYFTNPKVVKDKLGIIVYFDPDKRMKRVVWEHSKRFMFGSLLLFSRDEFNTILFGTVMERTMEDLKKGYVIVQLSEGTNFSNDLFINEFVMVESQVYFEPYYQVLKALQNMKTETFPMEKYIIRAEMSDEPPKYVSIHGGAEFDIDGHKVSILNDESWPGPLQLKLDISQFNAFKSALTKEFVVIQGPPGTGKTFLGLKIAKVLLKNAPVWNSSRKPILVVCYTNHALDQFLEGLCDVTDKIVRVGGQSKSEILERFSLKEKRKTYTKRRLVYDLIRDIRYRMSDIMACIKHLQNELEVISSNRVIISLSVLKGIGIQDQLLDCFRSNEVFVEWLAYGMYDDIPYHEAENQNVDQNALEGNQEIEAYLDEEEDLQQHMLDDINDLELDVDEIISHLSFAFNLGTIEEEIGFIELQIHHAADQNLRDPDIVNMINIQEEICEDLKLKLNYFKKQLSMEELQDRRTVERLLQIGNLWQLQPDERWIIYRHWINRLKHALLTELHRLEVYFRTESRMYEEAQQINDLDILRNSLVVGMTTTGAARLQALLQNLQPKIVIVEEAAEVLESHIVISLTRHCEHLIMIGDHKQLRPSPAVFRLARDYNFDISLFERMLKNNMHCEVLKVQHRMRPEIVNLIVPSIYPELLNHSSVHKYEKINGMLRNIFFITHNHPEEEVDDTSSHKNTYEGDFLIALCRYLIRQGYEPSRITILATYSGQLFYLRGVRKQYKSLNEVRITVVDNFQGEENDIILLSLVRSNKDANIGFLKTENRVCVALSRAKMGLYIIGNMENLTRKSTIWPKIKETLQNSESYGTHLTLRCQVHPSEFTKVCSADDFNNCPEGGCSKLCGAELVCGHKCKSVCHIRNREHAFVNCYEPCDRNPPRCNVQHICRKLCYEDCGDCTTVVNKTLPCGHSMDLCCYINPLIYKCPVNVEVDLPDCGHKVKKPCHLPLEVVPCTYPCEERLQCGHSCQLKCHTKNDPDHLDYQCKKPCTRKYVGCKEDHICIKQCYEECGSCKIPVERKLPNCEHSGRMPCSQNPETYLCGRKCNKILPCEHPCPNSCSALCGNCQVKVMKKIDACGHSLQVKCCERPNPEKCMSACDRLLPCRHKCTTVCCAPCTKKCNEEVISRVRPVCGHSVHIPCHLQSAGLASDSEELLSRCQLPCGTQLSCGHVCAGTCGECMQGRIHKACKQKCGRILICGHSCNIPCAENCPPCNRKCSYKCKHSRCSRQCGQPCIKCKEPCDWACIHQRCTKLCFELCNRKPCNEPCDKLLPCKHPCIGFCGETCPPLCRVCNKDEVTEIFFGSEDEPDARFVYLEDCKHVMEASGLEQWMTGTDGEIKMKDCPKCKTPISKTQRYVNIVKKIYEDICRVKMRCFGMMREIEATRDELKQKLKMQEDYKTAMKGSKEYLTLYMKLSDELKPVYRNRRNILSVVDTGTMKVQIEIFSQIVNYYIEVSTKLVPESKESIMSHLDMLLRFIRMRQRKITQQEIDDVNLEIQRFYRLCQLHEMISEGTYRQNRNDSQVMKFYDVAYRIANSKQRFLKEHDTNLKNALQDLGKAMKSVKKITDAERREIVMAMGFKPGHWYKCPNGHIYAIGECGGAMQESKCNECGARIGGYSHRLLRDNSLATEMDGATRPAYPW